MSSLALPGSLAEAIEALAASPGAQVLAGGTDFMVEVNFRHRNPDAVVALRNVAELRRWEVSADGRSIFIGSGVTWTTLQSAPLAIVAPALAEAARTVGSPQIRNAGTIGGNLGTCSPAGDGLPVLSALDAQVHVAGGTGSRILPIHEFMVGVKRTALQPGELIEGVTIPTASGWQGYAKVGVRNAMVISVAGACLVVDGRSGRTAVALGAVGPTIVRARAAEDWLMAATSVSPTGTLDGVDQSLADEFGRRVAAEARPIDDHRSTAAYRRRAVEVMSSRLLRRAAQAGSMEQETR